MNMDFLIELESISHLRLNYSLKENDKKQRKLIVIFKNIKIQSNIIVEVRIYFLVNSFCLKFCVLLKW